MVRQNGTISSYDSDKIPKYPLEHLATFKVSRESGVLRPSDGMKKLVKLNEKSGIWPHKMLISFENDWVLISDYENGSTIEGFPSSIILNPTAFTSDDPQEIFNNILIFVVGGSLAHTDMHIFQCTTVSAIKLVSDMEALKKGNSVQKHEQFPLTPIQKNSPNKVARDQYGLKEVNTFATVKSYEFDINLLNHCIEDIEKFVTRLHFTIGAAKELKHRENTRGQGDTYGEGLLRSRAQKPIESEYLDILAKFKLAFNLIAKLRTQIKETKIPIHHLFISLEYIVELGHEQCGQKNLPEQVIMPLLYLETMTLLERSLNRKEVALWHSLGDPWNIPRENWPGRTTAYRPVFFDGWCPEIIQDGDDNMSVTSLPLTSKNGSDTESTITVTPDNEIWLSKLEKRNCKIAKVIYSRAATNNRELDVTKGEYLEVIDNSRKWWKTRASSGRVGYVPYTILTLHDYGEEDEEDYEFEIPEPIPSPVEARQMSSQAEEIQRKSIQRRSISMPNPPPPPPPMPPSEPTTPYATMTRNAGILAAAEINNNAERRSYLPENKNKTQDDLTNELQLIFAMRRNREDINIKQLPDVYINERSTPSEVSDWLRQKEFSERVIHKLARADGKELFNLKLNTLIEYFGVKDGRRLDGMIIIQKKHCNFQTAGKSELRAILAKARQKTGEQNEADEVF